MDHSHDKATTLNLEFQGFPCSPVFEMRRSPGLDSDYSFVHVARQDLGTIVIQDPPGGFAKAIATLADLSAPAGKGKLYTIGDVLLQDLDDNDDGVSLRFRHMLLDESSVEAPTALDGDTTGLVRIGLRDMRALWNQGVVFAWVNVAAQYAFVDLLKGNPKGTQDARLPDYVPGSTDKGKPWTFRRVLEAIILPNLPGKPKLSRLSKALEGRVAAMRKWDGVPTKQAFQDVLAEVDAVCVLDLDANVSVWRRGDGPLQDNGGNAIPADSPSIASRCLNLSYRATVPDTVLVVGRPIVDTKEVILLPVGEIAPATNGFLPKLVPLIQALSTYGMTGTSLKTLILLEHDKRRAAGLTDEATRAFEKWAFKWFAIPTAIAGLKNDIPIENCAETDHDGQRLPPVVRAGAIRVDRVVLRAGPGSGVSAGSAASGVAFNDGSLITVRNLPVGAAPQEGSYTIDAARGLIKFAEPRLQVETEGVSVNTAKAQPALVTLIYGVSRKPAPDGLVKLSDRYASAWRFNGAHEPASEKLTSVFDQIGKGETINSVDLGSLDLSTVLVVETDLQQLNPLTGNGNKSNKPALDAVARTLAEPIILANRFVPGAVVELVGVADVACTGRVQSVVWSASENGLPTTVAHDGRAAPLRSAPQPVSLQDIRKGLGKVGFDTTGGSLVSYLPGSRNQPSN